MSTYGHLMALTQWFVMTAVFKMQIHKDKLL